MKAIYILLLMFFVSIGVGFGQKSTEVVDQIVDYRENGDTLRSTYTYNQNGKVVITLLEKRNNGKWENNYLNYNNYVDSNEYISKRSNYGWHNGKWNPSYTYDSIFDFNWHLLEILAQRWENENLLESTKISHINDSDGNALITLRQNMLNGEYINDYRETRTFDENGNALTCFRENWQEGLWINSYRYTYTYDKWRNVTSEYFEFWKDSIWVKDYRYQRTYDDQKNILVESNERWHYDTLDTETSIRTTKTYNANNDVITEIKEKMVNGMWEYLNRITFEYYGKLYADIKAEHWINNRWVLKSDFLYRYNSNKFLILYLWTYWENNKIASAQRQATTFSSDGKSSNYYYQNTEYVNDISTIDELLKEENTNVKWLNVFSKYAEYDAQNRFTFYDFGSWKDDHWEISSKHSFTYNENGDTLTKLSEGKSDNEHWDAVQHSYAYDLNRNRLSDIAEAKHDGKFEGSYNRSFNYNPNNHIIKVQNIVLDHSEWKNKNFYFYLNVANNLYRTDGYKAEITYKTVSPVKDEPNLSGFSLNCSPNPSPGPLNINYTLTEPAITTITISNLMGIEMANISGNQFQLPGTYNLNYDASNLVPGAYFITVKAGNKTETKKIIINY